MKTIKNISTWLDKTLYYQGDDQETLQLKKTFIIFIFIVVPPVIGLTALTILLEVPILELYGWCLLILYSSIIIAFFWIRRHVEVFFYTLSTFLLLLTFYTVIRQGGFFYSGGILYSSLATCVFAFVFKDKKLGVYTSLLYIAGLLIVAFLQSHLNPAPEMVKGNINLIFTTINAIWLSIYILVVIYFVFEQRAKDERTKMEKIKEVDDLKSRLFTNITHEFRTPLTIILGASSPESKTTPNLMPMEGKGGRMELIRNNANKLLHLVNQMLNLSKLESGTLKPRYVQLDIMAFLSYLMDSCRSLAEKKDIVIQFLRNPESLDMDVDTEKMEDVILNLIHNAIKFTPKGGHILLTAEVLDNKLSLKISDTGIGISPSNLNRIFERFFQIEDDRIPVQQGSGIGLTLVKEYLKLMGGTIDVNSVLNEGTEFTITLPITNQAKPSENVFGLTDEGPLNNNQPISKDIPVNSKDLHTVLIVEDNEELSHYLNHLISPYYHTLLAYNGQEGIEMAMHYIPDLVLSDVMMPHTDGYELCDTLKNDYKTNHIPVILLTARADTESKLEGLKTGADDYIYKPFQPQELLLRIKMMIEQRDKLKLKFSMESMDKIISGHAAVNLDERFLSEVYGHLEKNYHDEEFGIDALCNSMAVSRVQLHRKLVGISGLSASHFINKFRIQKAAELLRSGRLTVSEVAYEVGFRDPNYFSRTFSKITGSSPADFRKQKQ